MNSGRVRRSPASRGATVSRKPEGELYDESDSRRAARIERANAAAWTQAIEDVVASTSARAHCAGENVRERQRKVRETLVACLPLAATIFRESGHPVVEERCLCRAYALLDANAYHSTEDNPEALREKMIRNRRRFDTYIKGRS